MPAVKANAYGHGAVAVSRECIAAGANALGVASIDEAIELREEGVTREILIMGCQAPQAAPEIVRWDVACAVSDATLAEALSREATRQLKTAVLHIKVDTGMGRIGVAPDQTVDLARQVMLLPGVSIQGVFTHFTSSDVPDYKFTSAQISTFRNVVAGLRALGLNRLIAHTANSAGILAFPESHMDAVRPGIMLYGIYPVGDAPRTVPLRPALTFKTRIVFLKTADAGVSISYGRTHVLKRRSLVATLPVGYADGYSRRFSNTGVVAVRGMKAPVLGRVCMDQTMIDVTDVPGVSVGDEVVLYGGGHDYLSIPCIAEALETIPHEVLCDIGRRVPRIYKSGSTSQTTE
jgi:alanine racemase